MFTKKATVKEVKKKITSPRRNTYILTIDDEKIGRFNLMQSTNGRDVRFGIVIDKFYQGKGYGKQVMKLAQKEAKKLGAKKIMLEVFVNNNRESYWFSGSGRRI